MKKTTWIYLILWLSGLPVSALGQTGMDVLNIPANARSAALGINLDVMSKPCMLTTQPQKQAVLSVWNWISDVRGAAISIQNHTGMFAMQVSHIGDIELRDDIPTEQPLSTFQYSIFHTGGSYSHTLGELVIGFSGELIVERTLNNQASGISLNVAGYYPLVSGFETHFGFRNLGFMNELDSTKTDLPSEVWLYTSKSLGPLTSHLEINNGDFPLQFGLSYILFNQMEIQAGFQFEYLNEDITVYPSLGFTLDWSSFSLGYALYQINHPLGGRHFLSLYWDY